MKTKLRLGLALVLLIVVSRATYVSLTWPAIRLENFENIHQGMTFEEIETLLGVPPGYYGFTSEPWQWADWDDGGVYRVYPRHEIWENDELRITVYFDNNNRVVDKELLNRIESPRESVMSKIWRRLGWR